MHANQLSKSVLLLAVDRLQTAFPENVFYFPAYELVLDELRDYRFYAEDMVHPPKWLCSMCGTLLVRLFFAGDVTDHRRK